MSARAAKARPWTRASLSSTIYIRTSLRPMLRAGASDTELETAIRAAIAIKPERHEFREKPEKVIRFMSMTGG